MNTMDQRRRRHAIGFGAAVLAAVLMASWAGVAAAEPEQEQADLVTNGGFEDGDRGWQYQQWKGKPLPGYIDKDDMHEGLASFKFHEDGVDHELYMAKEVKFDPSKAQDYTLSVALKPQGMPGSAARVRVLIDGYGWLNKTTGKMDVIKTGGTQDWQVFTVNIPAGPLEGATKATIFIYHDKPSEGELGIDALSLTPAAAAAAAASPSVHPVAPLKGATYTTGSPVVILPADDARVAIRASPDQALYRRGALPRVTVSSVAAQGATLTCRVIDGFGQTLLEETRPAREPAAVDLTLPDGQGYYEVIATLSRGNQTLAEARRSIGELTAPPEPVGDEPFGLWIQGREQYPELGVRWVREGIYWNAYQTQGDAYLADRLKLFRWYRDNDIRVLAYPKHPHPHQTSREVIEDTPEAWRDLETWWSTMVRELAPEVDAWGVVNEPITGHWEGSDELIVRYWKLMRSIVDQYDADAPLVGPSLGLAPSNVTQYQKLLQMGFANSIDAVELHTYITHPEDNDWHGQTDRVREMTREAAGKDLPVWSTEHGSSATYETELLQAQHLMRSWLEVKKIGYPVVIWHMFSHPQGSDMREVNFGIFRNARKGDIQPQPRPAGLAFGVMTRQLAGATYRSKIDYLGPSIYAYVFERDGEAMAALWTTSQKTYDVTLAVGDQAGVTQTGLFGRVEPLEVRDGLVNVTVDRNPRFIAPLPAHYLTTEPIARLDEAVGVLPGGSGTGTLTLANPTQDPAEVRIEWLSKDGWRLTLPKDRWTLQPKASATETLTVAAPKDMAIGRYQVYGRVFLNGKFVTSLAAPIAVLPQVSLADVEPRFDDRGRAILAGTLRRNDPALRRATVQLGDDRSDTVTVSFSGDEAAFAVPVRNPASDRLESLQLIVRGSDDEVQVREDRRLSFVQVKHLAAEPTIDGELNDWPALSGDGSPAVRWGWDGGNLYLAVRVDDPRHMQSEAITEMWKQDSLQIGVAPNDASQLIRDFLPGLQEAEMFELDVALAPDGPAMYRHRTMNKHVAPVGPVTRDQLRYAVRHADGVTSYELRIPVEQVGLKPLHAGQTLRGSLLINANDGHGRQTTEWFGGINSAKDPNLFGHLILAE